MANETTLYQDEYCGMGGKKKGGGVGGGGQEEYQPCSASYEKQPVGGLTQAKHVAAMDAKAATLRASKRQEQENSIRSKTALTLKGLPAYRPLFDVDFVAAVYNNPDGGNTHRLQAL